MAHPSAADQIADFVLSHDLQHFSRDANFDGITAFASKLCETRTALVSLVEEKKQRFLSRVGFDQAETSRDVSFCAHAMLQPDVMIVPDATLDTRFAQNELVTGEPFIRFYAGAPLIADDGQPIGALCVIDSEPRSGLTELQIEGLTLLAQQVMLGLRSRRAAKDSRDLENEVERSLNASEQKFRVLADSMPQMVWSTLPDGFHDYYNARWYEFTGVPEGSTDGEGWNGMFHVDDQDMAWAKWRHSLATGEPYEVEYRLRNAEGQYRWTLGRALPLRDADGAIVRWFGTCTDIHDQKLLLENREIISQELSHRIKNIFSVIGGLISLSRRAHPEMADLAADLRSRVMALGRAHDFVRPHSAHSQPATRQTNLHGMLEELLSPYNSATRDKIVITGDNPRIDDRSTTPLALVFHELGTNAAKYGALSNLDGHIAITIHQSNDIVAIDWTEIDGPPVMEAPARAGFGSTLLEMSVERQLGGSFVREWNAEGLQARLNIPVSAMSRSAVNV